MPLVSVIVPNYNHAPYLRQRLDSIFNQTFQDFEVIILDDCSTDNSKEIIEEYRNRPQVSHVVYNETNSGSPFKQWAKGFDLAQGEYIWIAESDDWAELNLLEKLYNAHQSNSKLCLAFSDSMFMYPDRQEHYPAFSNDVEISGLRFIKEKLLFSNVIVNASAVLFRKNSIPKNSEYQQYRTAGDYLFWVQICESGDVFYKNKCLNHFRKHSSNTTSLNLANGILFKEELKVYQYLKSRYHLTKKIQNYTVLCWRSRLKVLEQQASQKSLETIREAKNDWGKEISYPSLTQTLCYTRLLIRKLTSRRHTQKHPWEEPFKNIGFWGLIWGILHLPNTNFRKWLT